MTVERRIKATGLGQPHYGNCERCGKPCSNHYMQQVRRIGQKNKGWTTAGFGHPECLKNGSWENAALEHDPSA